ncbi:hypothetical protein E3N88_44324 [Mikania micrantha]|uniref:Uncharacterized protein n=1 Tax=Mikania micrantha TaxID=192012 RepID=A0A5N6LCB7_9ASTR|nr:hypothetical protein E3N88_44324 [Mikania micrantha]
MHRLQNDVVSQQRKHIKCSLSGWAISQEIERGEEKEILVTFDLAVVSVDFPEFQPSDRLHFWTASSSIVTSRGAYPTVGFV